MDLAAEVFVDPGREGHVVLVALMDNAIYPGGNDPILAADLIAELSEGKHDYVDQE